MIIQFNHYRCPRTTIWLLSTNVHIATCSPTCSESKVRTATDSPRLRNYLKMYPCRRLRLRSLRVGYCPACGKQPIADVGITNGHVEQKLFFLFLRLFLFYPSMLLPRCQIRLFKRKTKKIFHYHLQIQNFCLQKCRGNLEIGSL